MLRARKYKTGPAKTAIIMSLNVGKKVRKGRLPKLSKLEKESLLAMARSSAIRKDFLALRKNRLLLRRPGKKAQVDAYLEFVNFVNAFANHARKPLSKMEGSNFKL